MSFEFTFVSSLEFGVLFLEVVLELDEFFICSLFVLFLFGSFLELPVLFFEDFLVSSEFTFDFSSTSFLTFDASSFSFVVNHLQLNIFQSNQLFL